jgi:hypothetical protein
MRKFRAMLSARLLFTLLCSLALVSGLALDPISSLTPELDLKPGTQVKASPYRNYRPPSSSRSPRRTTAGGTRGGCSGDAAINLTALAPQGHSGQTAASRPTLTWFLADQAPYPLELQFYRYIGRDIEDDRLEPLGVFDLGQSQPGYHSFTLPASLAPLQPGQFYRWKLVLKCEPGQPSKNQIAEADLQVVPASSPMAAATLTNPVDRSAHFIELGLWYEAIASLSEPPVTPAVTAYRRALLEDLAALEAENPEDSKTNFSQALRSIATQN